MAKLASGQLDVLGEFPSRSEAAGALALAVVNAGWSRADYAATLDAVAHISDSVGDWKVRKKKRAKDGGGSRRRSQADQDRRVYTTWNLAVAKFFASPPAGDRASVASVVAKIQEEMDARPWLWAGQAGKGNRQVMEALLEVCLKAGRMDPTVSIRQLAERTTVTDSTVHRAVRRLVDAGWIRIEEPAGTALVGDEAADGTRAVVALPRRLRVQVPTDLPDPIDVDLVADPTTGQLPPRQGLAASVHDAFVWNALGGVAGRLHAWLDRTPTSVRLLAARTGYRPATVRGHLRKMAAYGLAAAGTGGWTRGPAALDDVAAELGTTGTLADRAAKHAADRASDVYTDWLTEFGNRRGWRAERGIYKPDQGRLFGVPAPPDSPPRAPAAA